MMALPDVAYLRECFDLDCSSGLLTWKVRPREHFRTARGWRTFNAQMAGRREASVKAFREWIDPGEGRRTKLMQLQPKMGSGKKFVKLGPGVDVGEAPAIEDIIAALRGKNLACWCDLPAPGEPDVCHASVLIEIANRTCEEVKP